MVFADMFSLPSESSSDDGYDTYDGLPIVVLHDSAEDWAKYLEILYSLK